jgi:hypothetical protein
MGDLLAGEHRIGDPNDDDSYVMTSRNWAGPLIQRVGDCGDAGLWPNDVTLFDLGRALRRVCVNSEHADSVALDEIVRGWVHAEDRDR